MPLYDVAAYTASLRHESASACGLVCGLAFDPSGENFCALVSSGRITISSTNYDATTHSAFLPGYARALCAGDGGLYAAGDFGLLRMGWGKDGTTVIFSDARVDALAKGSLGVYAAVHNGIAAVVDEESAEPVWAVRVGARVESIMAMDHGFLVGCSDGTIRQFDVRTPSNCEPVRNLKLGNSTITTLGIDQDGSFVLAGDHDFNICSVHITAEGKLASNTLPFRPRAISCAGKEFFVGGSDRVDEKRCMLRFGYKCEVTGYSETSARSIYSIARHPGTGSLVAGGYSPEKVLKGLKEEIVDVYIEPPVRSFSVEM